MDQPAAEQTREALALDLIYAVQARMGVPLTRMEVALLDAYGPASAGEFSPVEAEMLVRFTRNLDRFSSTLQRTPRGFWVGDSLESPELRAGYLLTGLLWFLQAAFVILLRLSAGESSPIGWPWVWGGMAASLGLTLVVKVDRLRSIRTVQRELIRSRIIELIADGGEEYVALLERLPVPWRWGAAHFSINRLAGRVQLATEHLDWLLDPTGAPFRWNWLGAVPPLIGAGLSLFMLAGFPDLQDFLVLILPVFAGIFIGSFVLNNKPLSIYNTLSLVALMQRRFSVRLSDAPPEAVRPPHGSGG